MKSAKKIISTQINIINFNTFEQKLKLRIEQAKTNKKRDCRSSYIVYRINSVWRTNYDDDDPKRMRLSKEMCSSRLLSVL